MTDLTVEKRAELIIGHNNKIRCDFNTGRAVGFFAIWVLLTIVTLGLGLFFIQYYAIRAVVNTSYLVDSSGRELGRFECKLNFGDFLGHAILWALLTVVTLGLAIIVYVLRVPKYVFDNTRLIAL